MFPRLKCFILSVTLTCSLFSSAQAQTHTCKAVSSMTTIFSAITVLSAIVLSLSIYGVTRPWCPKADCSFSEEAACCRKATIDGKNTFVDSSTCKVLNSAHFSATCSESSKWDDCENTWICLDPTLNGTSIPGRIATSKTQYDIDGGIGPYSASVLGVVFGGGGVLFGGLWCIISVLDGA